jgi:orotidine-5'-phosphate decarboxylase
MTQTEAATTTFGDRVAEAVERKRSQLVLGLDPVVDLLPVELQGEAQGGDGAALAVERFCRGLIDAAAPFVVAIKPQLAFFEALGSRGMRVLEESCEYARDVGLLVIADAKRGDIGSTARAYAAGYIEPRGSAAPLADSITINPYLGRESVEPFLAACKRHGGGVFVVTKTSNAGSADIQDLKLSDGRVLWQAVAQLAREWGEELVGRRGLSSVGLVVGATYPRAIGEVRRLCPQQVLLLPAVGAQGAGPADVARAFTSGPASALVSASRSIDYAYRTRGGDWRTAAGEEASRLRDEVWAASGW